MEPNWDDLKVLLALSRRGSVAGAARELEVDHSTVSRRLTALEEVLGAQLLIRGGREFSWTAEGQAMVAAAEEVEATIVNATRQVRSAKLEVAGTVRVATTPGFLTILAPVLPNFLKRYPALKFEFSASLDRVDLARGDADIAVRFAKPAEPDLIARHVTDAGWYLYASNNYISAHKMPRSHEELSQHPLVLFVESLHQYGPGLRWLENYRCDGTVVTRVDNLQSAAQLLEHSSGIGVLPKFHGGINDKLGQVFPDQVASHAGYLVYHQSQRGSARIQAALEVLSGAIASQADKFSNGGSPTLQTQSARARG
jgi:DNA-binding transcriptional LysR family regulator